MSSWWLLPLIAIWICSAAAVELSLTHSSVKIQLAAVHGLTPVGSVLWRRH
ncbi:MULTISPECIES: hypothetical protein [unclassified Paenibacillus]|uniref:hypothetical protein n=1 Tax=unclassified Paenibacillus TaxID=185978 RepID=UPI0013923656|nr:MULTISPECIES: hypothetical protein [unclassified Paenibacillus]MCT1401210.1 hypothetical protein [Paenibacillus sp. p3-SID867]